MSTAVPGSTPAREHSGPTLGTVYEYTSIPLETIAFPSEDGPPKSWGQGGREKPFATAGPAANGTRPSLRDTHRWSSISNSRPQNLRRFGFAWWKYYFKVQMSRKKLPRFFYALCGILLLFVWLGIASSFATTLQSAEAANRIVSSNGGKPPPSIDQNALLLFLSGQISSFDPSKRALNVGWSALVVQGPVTDLSRLTDHKVSFDAFGGAVIALYRDTVARRDEELIANGTANGLLSFRLRAPAIKPIGFLGISDYDNINTDIGLGQKTASIALQPEFGYPLDVFTGNITFVAANNQTIERTGRLGSDVLPMSGAVLTDSILNFKIRTSTYSSCLDDNSPGCELTITFWVERTGLVKFCVLVVFFINWIITISIFLITGEALLLNRHNILQGTDILAICFTALFALPSVRSLLPGVPSSYGCFLDIIGILPNVIIVTLCTTFFTISRLRMRARKAVEEAERAAAEEKTV